MATERIIDGVLWGKLQGSYSFFIIDIDNFKQANDLHGHIFGDYCIREFVERLKKFCREDDIIGRIGGDEFVVSGRYRMRKAPAAKRPVCARSLTLSVRTAAAAGKCLSA